MKTFKLPSGVEFSEDELRVRAIAAFLGDAKRRRSGEGVLVDMHRTEAAEINGRIYVLVRDPAGVLKQVYCLRSDGHLTPLRRPPPELAASG